MNMQTLTNVKMIFRTSRKRRIIMTKNLCLDYLSLLFRGNGGGTYFFQLFLCCIMDNNFNVNDLRSFAKERSEKFRPGACFSKVPKLFGPISGATIAFISSQRRASKPSNLFVSRSLRFSYIKNM